MSPRMVGVEAIRNSTRNEVRRSRETFHRLEMETDRSEDGSRLAKIGIPSFLAKIGKKSYGDPRIKEKVYTFFSLKTVFHLGTSSSLSSRSTSATPNSCRSQCFLRRQAAVQSKAHGQSPGAAGSYERLGIGIGSSQASSKALEGRASVEAGPLEARGSR